jgi:hypothetical protein
MPGVAEILGATIHLEIGDIARFPDAEHVASYAGLVPTVHASGGKSWHGPTSPHANHYLRWAFVEAANAILMHRNTDSDQPVIRLCDRLKKHKCHGKAIVAVARHLAEARWWILRNVSGIGRHMRRWLQSLRPETGKRGSRSGLRGRIVIAKPGPKMLMPVVRADR